MTEDGRKGSTFNIIPISFHLRSEATREANKQKKGIPASLRDKKKKKKKKKKKNKKKKRKKGGTNVCIPNENCNAINLLTRTR